MAEAILHRDTPGDVGIANKTPAELKREDLAHVVTAAGKRLGEALRSIEEYLKTVTPGDAARIEAMRYVFYDIEQRVARTLRPADRFSHVRLYVLITEKLCRRPWLETAELALQGGADCLQLREKEMEGGELLCRARQLVALCRKYDAICILNDRPDIAILADADGVHVGQEDLPAIEVRKLVGREKIVGVSTHCLDQARQAVLDGADYIGVGPFFRSSTKPRDILPGPEYARQVAATIPIPAVAIAGITAENVDEVLACGIGAVAVSSAIIASSGCAEGGGRDEEEAGCPPGVITFRRPSSSAAVVSPAGCGRMLMVQKVATCNPVDNIQGNGCPNKPPFFLLASPPPLRQSARPNPFSAMQNSSAA